MRVGNVQIEEEKIDHMSIKKAIGKISHDAGQQERQRDVAPNIWWPLSQKKNQNNEKRDRRNYDEESVVVSEGTKRRARVRDGEPRDGRTELADDDAAQRDRVPGDRQLAGRDPGTVEARHHRAAGDG